MTTNDRDKRIAPRKFVTVKVGLQTEIGILACSSLNISNTGMFIITNSYHSKGEMLDLVIDLDDRPVKLKGEVVWTTSGNKKAANPGMGVIFRETSPEDQAALDNFLNRQ